MGQKRQREPRFAFLTKARWITSRTVSAGESMAKRLSRIAPFQERSSTDPSVVVTTYEGQHTHPSPVLPRSNNNYLSSTSLGPPPEFINLHRLRLPSSYLLPNSHFDLAPVSCGHPLPLPHTPSNSGSHKYCDEADEISIRNRGLLQDLLPLEMTKKEQ
ncbi:hypothetical protein HPP92_005105 [Vanilla planifolia]|uniref:WRKY domain-containing protein n=1 Tax=Vanilla planifolia TaxID=51239 RepID=A0A835VF26_VANPL|nr:hypothetical protein HPP92_005105 [Vanilla planifolia]